MKIKNWFRYQIYESLKILVLLLWNSLNTELANKLANIVKNKANCKLDVVCNYIINWELVSFKIIF